MDNPALGLDSVIFESFSCISLDSIMDSIDSSQIPLLIGRGRRRRVEGAEEHPRRRLLPGWGSRGHAFISGGCPPQRKRRGPLWLACFRSGDLCHRGLATTRVEGHWRGAPPLGGAHRYVACLVHHAEWPRRSAWVASINVSADSQMAADPLATEPMIRWDPTGSSRSSGPTNQLLR